MVVAVVVVAVVLVVVLLLVAVVTVVQWLRLLRSFRTMMNTRMKCIVTHLYHLNEQVGEVRGTHL